MIVYICVCKLQIRKAEGTLTRLVNLGALARKADAFGYPFQLTHFRATELERNCIVEIVRIIILIVVVYIYIYIIVSIVDTSCDYEPAHSGVQAAGESEIGTRALLSTYLSTYLTYLPTLPTLPTYPTYPIYLPYLPTLPARPPTYLLFLPAYLSTPSTYLPTLLAYPT